ncbi:MAG: V-type ATPase subunit [Roseburia sp.]|nr:V-type ATPase subunit [Roseburia sp.]
MASGLLQYSGLVTKTKAMHGELLPEEELCRLMEYETVEEIIAFLRESKGYAPIFKSHDEMHHRAQVEAVMDDSLYSDYMRLYRFAGGEQRKGLEILFFRYEVNVLKNCLKHMEQGGREYNLGYLNLFFDRHSCYDTAALTRATNMAELIAALSGTRYEKLMGRLQENPQLSGADYEMQLDIYYYRTVWKMKDKLTNRRTKQIFTRVLGTEIDWLNIMWMYRFKRFYHRKPTDIYADMIPVSYRLKKKELQKMLETEKLEEFVEVLGHTAYFTDKDPVVSLGDEITFRLVMEKTYRQICRAYPMSLAPVLWYLYNKENEIDDLTTILEGVRYRIPPKEIQELVITTEIARTGRQRAG